MQKNGTTRTLHTVKDADGAVTSRVRRTVLPSGLRVVTEQMAGARSASIGVWVAVGSRDETPALHGCSHFLEHLLFKGTPERSAMDISVALDAVGGEFNAFTTKEYTVFHARVLDEDLPTAVDVLGDMVTASTIAEADVEAERDVILDEIAMHDDDPDDVVHNLFAQPWGDTPLGRPIAGTEASITAMTRAQIHRFYGRHYRPDNMVVSVAGNLDHATVVRQVRQAFGRGGFLDVEAAPLERIAADLLQVTISPVSKMHGVEVRELRLPVGSSVSLVIRDGQVIVPEQRTTLRHGDDLLVVTPRKIRDKTEERLRQVSEGGRLGRWLG